MLNTPEFAVDALTRFCHELGDTVALRMESGKWINVPVMTGFRSDCHFSPKVALFGMVGAGVNVSRAPRKTAYVGEVKAEVTEWDFGRHFGFQIGLGVLVNLKYSLEVRYVNLSTPSFDGTRRLSERVFLQIATREDTTLGEEHSISMIPNSKLRGVQRCTGRMRRGLSQGGANRQRPGGAEHRRN